jgi:DNA ligase-1
MSVDGEPDVTFHVFDDCHESGGFERRLHTATRRTKGQRAVVAVKHQVVEEEVDLLNYEEDYLEQGYEGVMLRHPDGPYKHGRSTLKESWLLKLKRFSDSEAGVVGFQELMHNANEAKENELGKKERSHHKAGLVGRGVLGAFTVQDLKTGVEFDIGTGFTQADREIYWAMRKDLVGAIVKYKFFPTGSKEKPRFPVFTGFRDKIDL